MCRPSGGFEGVEPSAESAAPSLCDDAAEDACKYVACASRCNGWVGVWIDSKPPRGDARRAASDERDMGFEHRRDAKFGGQGLCAFDGMIENVARFGLE